MKCSREANPFLFIFKSHEHIYRLSSFKIQNFVLLDQDIIKSFSGKIQGYFSLQKSEFCNSYFLFY